MTTANSKVLRAYYTKISALETATGRTFKEGDIILDSDITGASSLSWQQIALNGPISDLKFMTEALEAEQYGPYTRDTVAIKGDEKPEGVLNQFHNSLTSTTHLNILKNALGAVVAGSGNSDTVASDAINTTTIEATGTSIDSGDIGKFINIGDNKTVLLGVSASTLTLASKINAKAGDTILVPAQNHFDLDTLDDDPFILFVETEKDNHLVSWVRFGLDFSTAPNQLFKMTFNFQGDSAPISTLTNATIGTVVAEQASLSMNTTTFKGVHISTTDNYCANTFDFKLTRDMTRKACQGTESQNGNGGTDRKQYKTELTVVAYESGLNSEYEENDYITVLAQKSGIAIYAEGALIKSQDTNTITDNMHTTTYVISANVDMSKKLMISL